MEIFKKIKNIFKRDASGESGNTCSPRSGGISFLPNFGGDPMSVAAVYRCVDLLSNKVAVMPFNYRRKKGEVFTEDTSTSLNYLLNVAPSATMSAFTFKKMIVQYLLLRGNAYIIPMWSSVTDAIDYSSLVLVNPSSVIHNVYDNTYTVNDPVAGISGVYDESDIIHILNLSLDGKTGLSTLSFARLTTSIGLTADRESLSRFENGGSIRGIVSNGARTSGYGNYQDAELKKTATDLDDRFRAGERIVNVPGEAQFSPISMTSADMEFLSSQKFNVRQIARFFGVNPTFLFDDTSNNYKSAEQAASSLLNDAVAPIAEKIEIEFARKLITPRVWKKLSFKFDSRELLASDLLTLADYQAKTIASGVYTPNEWRLYENKEPLEGGDTMLVSANLKSMNELLNPNKPDGNGQE